MNREKNPVGYTPKYRDLTHRQSTGRKTPLCDEVSPSIISEISPNSQIKPINNFYATKTIK